MSKKLSAIITSILVTLGLGGCTRDTPVNDTPPVKIEIDADTSTAGGIRNYAFDMFRTTVDGSNTVVSPVSILYALSMTANGAAGDTLTEMETVLGAPVNDLNPHLCDYNLNLTQTRNKELTMANAVWVNQLSAFELSEDFSSAIDTYYGANVYLEQFSDETLDSINGFVNDNTNGMIEKILESINTDAVMYLVNAVSFEGEWYEEYKESQIITDGVFTNRDESKGTVNYLCDHDKNIPYLKDENALGFIKYYKNADFAFVALLPDEGTDIIEYAKSLTGDKLKYLMDNCEYADELYTRIPEFTVEWGGSIKKNLEEMGMEKAFRDNADFSRMSESGAVRISEVIHRAKIEVDRKGTKAAAATVVEMKDTMAMPEEEDEPVIVEIYLERPFVYMIVDTQTDTPVFIGTYMKAE